MSNILVSKNEMLVVCVNHPATLSIMGRPTGAWSGVLETKCQDYTIDQIAALAGKPEHLVYVFKIGKYGSPEDITFAVVEWMEANP